MDNQPGQIEQSSSKIAIFRGKEIRKAIYQDEWYFSITDIIEVLTGSANPRRYWSDLKSKLIKNEGFSQLYEKIVQLKLMAPDGKLRETDTANTETIFRIIQSVPSPKAEPFKRWLAKLAMNVFKRLKIQSLRLKEVERFIKRKDTPMIGSKEDARHRYSSTID